MFEFDVIEVLRIFLKFHLIVEQVVFRCRSEVLSEVESWLKTLPCHNQKAVKCGSSTLDEPVIKQIEEAVEKFKVFS